MTLFTEIEGIKVYQGKTSMEAFCPFTGEKIYFLHAGWEHLHEKVSQIKSGVYVKDILEFRGI